MDATNLTPMSADEIAAVRARCEKVASAEKSQSMMAGIEAVSLKRTLIERDIPRLLATIDAREERYIHAMMRIRGIVIDNWAGGRLAILNAIEDEFGQPTESVEGSHHE